jgi:protoporphyrinogen oxidase
LADKERIIIIGAGLTGLSTAYHLNEGYRIFEKEEDPGGLCRTVSQNGFSFDFCGHLLHLRNEYTQKLVPSLLKNKCVEHQRKAYIQYRDCTVPFPFQAHLSSLPPRINKDCLLGFINAYFSETPKNIRTFGEWVCAYLGKGLAEHFFVPYNTKLYGTNLKDMTPDWCDMYVPKPNLEETIDGAIGIQKGEFGYNASFLYPKTGGIQSLVNGLVEKVETIHLNRSIRNILWKERRIIDQNGEETRYESLVSSMPLPELLNALAPLPAELFNARNALRWRSVHCLNLGVGKPFAGDTHWAYFPEAKYIFYRVGFFHSFAPNLTPPDCSSFYVEVAANPEESFDERDLFNRAIEDLIKAGILSNRDEILARCYLPIPHAYVVYNHDRQDALKEIHGFLKGHSIYSVGRYGEWKYSSMETALLDGKAIAEQLKA